jgi:hypothetical protein
MILSHCLHFFYRIYDPHKLPVASLAGNNPCLSTSIGDKQGFSPPSADAEVQQAQPPTILAYPKSL